MKTLLKYFSFAGLALMFVSAVMVFNGKLEPATYRMLALVGTLMWFGPVPFWMKRRLHQSD
jgi:hypothetical protein